MEKSVTYGYWVLSHRNFRWLRASENQAGCIKAAGASICIRKCSDLIYLKTTKAIANISGTFLPPTVSTVFTKLDVRVGPPVASLEMTKLNSMRSLLSTTLID